MNYSTANTNNFEASRVCIIIPTYNNAATLANIIADVALYSKDIIVVNDGSTDNTESIVKSFDNIQYIGYPKNVGKGWALRKAFAYAVSKNYTHAITIDSDGQHFAKDIPAFLSNPELFQNTIVIGSRNMNQAFVPGGSSFGNKFSNFWFKVETGLDCTDTQSGFRMYPILQLSKLHFFTRKYEFEIEVLVRAAWKSIDIKTVPISVYYAPKETRISHFRPYKDFLRISVLNIVLITIALLYVKPVKFIGSFFKKELRQKFYEQLFESNQSDRIKALSVAFGIFMGIIPIWGFQLMAAIALAILLKLNKFIVIVAANISIPPMLPIIIYSSYTMGAMWMGDKAGRITFGRNISLQSISNNITQYIYGSITLSVVASILFGLVTFIALKLMKKKAI